MNSKFLLVLMMIVVATGLLFSGCGNKDQYKNMRLIVEQSSIEIVLDDDTAQTNSDATQDGTTENASTDTEPNIAYLDAHIENKNAKQSKRILFDIVDESIAIIDDERTSVNDNKYKVAIKALKAGTTYITVMSLEGNKTERVKLTVIEKIKAMAFDPDLSIAVAVGEEYNFNTSALNYEPITTNQKDVTFSLENEVDGVSISPSGTLSATAQPTDPHITVVATSTANPELIAKTNVYIYTKVDASKIHIVDANSGEEILDTLTIGKNSKYNNQIVKVEVDNETDEYIAYAQVSDISAIKVDRVQGAENTNLEFKITGIEQSKVKVTFNIGIVGFSAQTYITKSIDVEIIDLVDTIYVNGSSTKTEITVFDVYNTGAETKYGTKVLIEVSPSNASNKKITFSATDDNITLLQNFDFYTADGQPIDDILTYSMSNSGILYINYKQGATFKELSCQLIVEANREFSDDAIVTNTLDISTKIGIKKIAIGDNTITYIDLTGADYTEIPYSVNGTDVTSDSINGTLANFDLSSNRIMVQKSNIISAKNDGGRLFVKPLAVGTSTLSILSPNGMIATTTIQVVIPANEVSVNVDSIFYKNIIASVEKDENDLLSKINANVNGEFMLELEKAMVDGTIWNLSYVSSNPSVAYVSNSGLVRTLYKGDTTITVKFDYVVKDTITNAIREVKGEQEISLHVFRPITTFDIGKSSTSVYDIDTIGYLDALQYSAVSFDVQMNECDTSKSDIRLYIYGEAFDYETSETRYTMYSNFGILNYEGNGKGIFYGRINEKNIYSAKVKIVAVVTEYGRKYTSICTITVAKMSDENKVQDISIINLDSYTTAETEKTYYTMNFKAGLGLGTETENNKSIIATALPKNAINTKLYYFAYDDLEKNLTEATPASKIVYVTQEGVVYPLKAGKARILIVPRDRLNDRDDNKDYMLSSAEILLNLKKLQENNRNFIKEVIVTVSDGTIENPYHISSTSDFLDIATGLDAHYVLTRSIDLSSVSSLSAFGSEEKPFTGSIRGRYYLDEKNDIYVDNKIFGIKLNKTISTTASECNYGLFGVVKSSVKYDEKSNLLVHPSFSYLTLEFKSISIKTSDSANSSSTAYNIGLLAGKFSGTMTNVNIAVYGACEISLTNANANAGVNFGAFSGIVNEYEYEYLDQNGNEKNVTYESILELCKLYGSETLQLNLQVNTSNIGGFVGVLNKNAKISGQYSFSGTSTTTNTSTSSENTNASTSTSAKFLFTINGQNDDYNVDLVATFKSANTTNIIGGIVGKNSGSVLEVAGSGSVIGKQGTSVGGLVGQNLGAVKDVYSAMEVNGETNVGGVVGTNNGTINLAVVESFEYATISGTDAVGGVVGFNDGGAIMYASSTSFITAEKQYAVEGYSRVGGLIGVNAGNVSKSYAQTKVYIKGTGGANKYAGGFIGQISSGKLENTYSITDVYRESENSTIGGFFGHVSGGITLNTSYSDSNLDNFVGATSVTISGSNNYYAGSSGNIGGVVTQKSSDDLKKSTTFGNAWDFTDTYNRMDNINNGYPYLLYVGSEFVAFVPKTLEITVKETVDNKFIKVGDKRALVLIQKKDASKTTTDDSENTNDETNKTVSDYEFDIFDLIELKETPTTSRIVRLNATVVDGTGVIMIEGGKIIVLSEGYAKIRISSQLDATVFDEFEIYATYGLNSFKNDLNGEMKIFLDTSKEINYTFENGDNIVGQKYGIAYKGLLEYANFNYESTENINSETYHYIDYNYSKILNAKAVVEKNAVYEYAYINAKFGDESVKVLLPWTENKFNLDIFNGATDLQLNKSFSSILPNQTAQVTVNISTDVATDFVSKITIKENDQEIETVKLTCSDELEPSLKTIKIECSNDNYFGVKIIGYNFDNESKQIQMIFELAVSDDLRTIANDRTFTFEFSVGEFSKNDNYTAKFTKKYNLQILPQTIEKITMIHFPNGNLREDEVARDRISSGIDGVMKINVYPNYSQVDYIDITSSIVSGEKISFTQLVENGSQLEKINPDNIKIDNGIRLRLVSTKVDNGYAFDGNLYVGTLIRSNMAENLPFVVQITAYKDGNVVYNYSKTLLTQFSPSISIDYNEKYIDQIARGVTLDVPLKINTMPGKLTLSVIDITDKNGKKTDEYKGKVSFISAQTTFNSTFVGSLTAQLFADVIIPAGTKFKIRVELETVVDNVKIIATDEREITVVDYIIMGVTIENATTDANGTNHLVLYLSKAQNLKAKISAIYATRPSNVDASSEEGIMYAEIIKKIEKFEKEITKANGKEIINADNSTEKIQVWYSSKTVDGINKDSGSFNSTNGSTDYYQYYYAEEEGCYKAYGKKISNVAVISLYVAYTFENGIPKLFDVINGTTDQAVYYKQIDCILSIENESTEEIPLPVYTAEEFISMQSSVHYILMNDIELSSYTPMTANFASLDGNGKIIKINSFNIDTSKSTVNVGLFATVSANTVIKNVVLDVNGLLNGGDSTNLYTITDKSQVNFGLFAGSNAGVITNCDVVNITNLDDNNNKTQEVQNTSSTTLTVKTSLLYGTNYTSNYIGLFVGQNTGYVTNSRVFRTTGNIGLRRNVNGGLGEKNSWIGAGIDLVANGVVAGFIAYNEGEISACYATNITINNNSVIANASYTAGFVAINAGGYVSNSYAEGTGSSAEINLKSQGSVAGFVLSNSATISNCYADFGISSPSNSAGFVNENYASALVEYCYTTCQMFLAGGLVGDNASFRPFTGVNDFNEIQNAGTIVYSYYSKGPNTSTFADESAIAIAESDLGNKSEYVGFAFVTNEKIKNQGIWEMDASRKRPILTSANQIAVSIRELASDATNQADAVNDALVYSYNVDYESGSENNPYIINTAEKFNNLFKDISIFGKNNIASEGETTSGTKYIRIVCDLNFGATSETADGLNSSKVEFSAVLDGNNMLMNSITLAGEKTTKQNEFGMFKTLNGAVVKNIRMQFNEVSATEIPVVGTLCGKATDSIILGVKILGEGNYVQGKNVVGGVVGIALGDCEIQTIESNISVRSTYRKGSQATDFCDLTYGKNSDGELEIGTKNVSYAGGLIGAVLASEENKMVVRTLKVSGAVSIGAERTGGIIAVNYAKLYDLNFVAQITESNGKQELSGDDVIGGIVGINFGSIEKARLTYDGDDLTLVDKLSEGVSGGKTNLFIGASRYVGGLVGANYDGKIKDSYNRVNVTNKSAEYAGAIAGYVKGGEFDSIYVTGSVNAKIAFGSAFGYLDKNVKLENGLEKTVTINEFKKIVLINNYSTTVAQSISGGAKAGILAGYVNADYFKDVFAEKSDSLSYVVNRLPLNLSGTSYVNIDYFGSAKFDKMDITQEEYTKLFKELNSFGRYTNNDKISWFGDDNLGTYSSNLNNKSEIFASYEVADWTKEVSTFPLLKITTQASEIIIDDKNKNEFVDLIQKNPNATFIIKCDIKMYTNSSSGNTSGDLDKEWTSLGTSVNQFSGKIQGQKIEVNENGKKVERFPIIEIKKTLLNYCNSATISDLTIKVSIPKVSISDDKQDTTNISGNYYFGSVANYATNSTFRNLTIVNGAQINVTGTRSEEGVTNYVGGLIGYADNCLISQINFNSSMVVELQTTDASITSNIGGFIGYSQKSIISDVEYIATYTEYTDEGYNVFKVTSTNANIGVIVGNAVSGKIKSINLTEKQSGTSANSLPDGKARTPIEISSGTAESTLTFGGVAGKVNSLKLSSVENGLSNISITAEKFENTILVGGLVGEVISSTLSNVQNKANITLFDKSIDEISNKINLAGIAGKVSGDTIIITAQNRGQINVSVVDKTEVNGATGYAKVTGYIGGLIGEIVLSGSITPKLSESRNLGAISTINLYEAYVGGIIGKITISSANADVKYIIEKTYNESAITTQSGCAYIENCGGFIGMAEFANVSGSYSVGRVISKTTTVSDRISIGGFIGELTSKVSQPYISKCYSAVVVKAYADPSKNKVYSKGFIGNTTLTTQNVNTVNFDDCYYVGEFAQSNYYVSDNATQKMHDYTANFVSYADMLKKATFNKLDVSDYGSTAETTFVMTDGSTLPMLTKFYDSTNSELGTVYQPIQIDSVEALNEFTKADDTGANKYYLQTNSITANANTSTRAKFSGVFDGGNYEIIELTNPLFNEISIDAVVASVNIQQLNLTASESGDYGAIAKVNCGTILFCSADGEITFTSSCSNSTFGGLVGKNFGHIGFSSSNVNIGQTDAEKGSKISVGGIAGYMEYKEAQKANTQAESEFAQISNCFATGTLKLMQVTGDNLCVVGGIVGNLVGGNLQLCYSASHINYLNDESVKAYGAVYGNLDDTNKNKVAISNVYNDTLATLLTEEIAGIDNITMKNIMTNGLPTGFDRYAWSSFAIDSSFCEKKNTSMLNYGYPYLRYASKSVSQIANKGQGSKEKPYLIKNQSSFEIINAFADKGKSYIYMLDNDIYCVTGDYINTLQGTLEGNGKTIYNLSLNVSGSGTNGFINENNGTISNLTFVEASAVIQSDFGGSAFGLVVGNNAGTINNVKINNSSITFNGSSTQASSTETENSAEMSIGGLVGINSGTITGSSINTLHMILMNSIGSANLGGFVGKMAGGAIGIYNENREINCSVLNLTIDSNKDSEDSGFHSLITSSVYTRVGGFVGYVTGGVMRNCGVTGSEVYILMVSESNLGGFAGQIGSASNTSALANKIVYCTADTELCKTGESINIGGFAGYSSWVINYPTIYVDNEDDKLIGNGDTNTGKCINKTVIVRETTRIGL